MPTQALNDPVIVRFRAALGEAYGERLQRVVLFGSRARGDAAPGSDYDVAVFLRDAGSLWEESGRLAEIETDILFETGAVINALAFPAADYHARTPLMHELHRDGREI
ncbi:MAG: nucleotidyltransferase domain-containing protein [Hyphomicrobiales bacterium]|nr:nucleotidyltransferase domain-containing protein [Hyphomicrobiales bacterium]MBV8442462.1 nucleotidyltransferase domain-containing protein [Hyphomicrobiales bacterium]